MLTEWVCHPMRKNEEYTVLGTDFETLFGQYYKPLCVAAYTYLRNTKDAEDIVQQLFVRLWEHRSAYHAREATTAYLLNAVRNACLNHSRRGTLPHIATSSRI